MMICLRRRAGNTSFIRVLRNSIDDFFEENDLCCNCYGGGCFLLNVCGVILRLRVKGRWLPDGLRGLV